MEFRRYAKDIIRISLPIAGIIAVSLLGFSNRIKTKAIREQRGICPVCGKQLGSHCEAHHKIPQALGGNNRIHNCVVVHSSNGTVGCHKELDSNAFKGHIFLSSRQPDVSIGEVPDDLFRNKVARKRALNGFGIHPKKEKDVDSVLPREPKYKRRERIIKNKSKSGK